MGDEVEEGDGLFYWDEELRYFLCFSVVAVVLMEGHPLEPCTFLDVVVVVEYL